MITLTLIALSAIARQDQAVQSIKVLGREVPVSFPSGGPFNERTVHVDFGDWKFEVKPDGTIGQRYLVDGGWGDFKSLYERSKSATDRKPYRIKVIVVQYSTIIETSAKGVVRQRRGSLDDGDIETIAKSLATLKGMVEGASNGTVDVTIDASLDNDPVVEKEEMGAARAPQANKLITLAKEVSGGVPFGPSYVSRDVAPQINDEKFDTDDGVYRGPFDSVLVIHGGLERSTTVLVEHTPVTSLSFGDGEYDPKSDLPARMFDAWRGQLGVAAAGANGLNFTRFQSQDAYPTVVGGPAFQALLRASRLHGAGSSTSVPFDASAAGWESLTWQDPAQNPGVVVRGDVADYLADQLKGRGVKATSWRMTPFGPSLVLEGVTDSDVASALTASGIKGELPPPRKAGTATGDYECSVTKSPSGGEAFEVKQKGAICRGHALVFSSEPLALKPEASIMSMQVKLSSEENIALGFYSGDNKLGTVILSGDVPGPSERPEDKTLLDRSVPGDDQWHLITVPLGAWFEKAPLTEVRVEAPFRCRYERLTRGPANIGVADITFVGTATESNPAVSGTDSLVARILKVTSPPSSEDIETLATALRGQSPTPKLTALSMLQKIKAPELVPELSTLAQSASIPYALMSLEALGYQDTPEAWAKIRQTVEEGPFDHNRRFAAAEIAKKPDPAMAAALNFMATRSRHARFEAVRALGKIKTTSAGVFMATIMNLEPDPMVRLEIAKAGDPNVGPLGKRLLYAAVNDPSQWVRMASYANLIDATDASIQEEALKGVRDEAVGVRMYVLDVMRVRAKDSYRPALRLAVTDTVPAVRAAALLAFATQPGPVDPNEVKNVFNDKDPTVKQALIKLAQAKGFKVPS